MTRLVRTLRDVNRVVMRLAGALLAVGMLGAAGEFLARRRDARHFPQQGRLVETGGLRLNLDCRGQPVAGVPTVVLEAGQGLCGRSWALVQAEVAGWTRVCSYDRAGYGWSPPAPAGSVRSAGQLARELRTLLQAAAVAPPYVLVGHSLGGLIVRAFHADYPDDVAGMVLVDASHEDQQDSQPPAMRQLEAHAAQDLRRVRAFVRWVAPLGVPRLLQRLNRMPRGAPRAYLDEMAFFERRPSTLETAIREHESVVDSAREVRAAGGLGNKPLVVLTAGRTDPLPGIPAEEMEAFRRAWTADLQPRLAALSTRGRQVVVADSGHMIPETAPQAVVDAIREVCDAVGAAPAVAGD
jgi:pimeloyl-ACP methyl ester carboxylesterase